jgi:hypothetical protein
MDTYVYHIEGWQHIDSVKVVAGTEEQAKNILLGSWYNGKPLVQDGLFKLIHIERKER